MFYKNVRKRQINELLLLCSLMSNSYCFMYQGVTFSYIYRQYSRVVTHYFAGLRIKHRH